MDSSNMAIVIGPNIAQHSNSNDHCEILAETELDITWLKYVLQI